MDIAALGLSVDSRPIERAVQALRQLPGASQAAASGADKLAGAAEREARAVTQSTASLGANARAAQVAGSAMRAANQNIAQSGGLARHEMINLSRQVQDIGVSLASGQSPFLVLVQQGTQVGDIFATTRGTIRGFAAQIASLITPTRLFVGGIVALGAAAYAGFSYWKSYALALDDLSRVAGLATVELSKLQTAASVRGIGQDDFASGMKRFADAVYEAKAGTNDLATLLRLNGETISDTAGTLDTVANLIQRASNDQQRLHILQQAGLPATMEWVRLTRDGADGLRTAKDEAVGLGGAINDQMVKRARDFDEAWDRAWTNFKNNSRNAFVDAASGLSGLTESYANLLLRLNPGLSSGLTPNAQIQFRFPSSSEMMRQEDRTTDGGPVRDAAWLAQQQRAIQLEQQRIALLGEAATAADRRREVELKLQAADLAGIKLTEGQSSAIRRRAMEEASLAETQKTLGVLGSAATETERYAARVQELGIALQRGDISQEQFNRALAAAHPLYESLQSAATNFATGFASDLRSGVSAMDALTNATSRLTDSLINIALNKAISSLFSNLGGIFGGSLGTTSIPGIRGTYHTGGIVGVDSVPGRYVHPAYFDDAPRFHSGGIMPGEYPAILQRGEGVFTKAQMAALGRGGASGVTVVVNNNAGDDVSVGEPRRGADGGLQIDVAINRAVKNALQSDIASHGPISQSIGRRFGLDPTRGIG